MEIIDGTSIGAAGDLIGTRVLQPGSGAALITGDPLNYIPNYAFDLNAEQKIQWSKDIPGLFRIDYSQKGKSTFISRTSNAAASSDTIHMLNGVLSASLHNYRVDVYADNMLNDRGRLAPNIVNYAPRAQPLTAGIRFAAGF
jgi:hypothetical protein